MKATHRYPFRAHRFAAPPIRQRGASLLFALSALVGLTIAGVAMMRTSDTSTLVAGNIGFHEAAVQSTDLSLEAAVTALSTFAKTTASYNHVTGSNYYASLDSAATDATQPPASRLSASVGNLITDTATGNTLRYVVERMCSATGAPNVTNCLVEDAASPVFRITTLVIGPRNTSEVVQHYVTAGGFAAQCAIITNTTATFNGQINITGAGNCVHSNADVSFTNSPNSQVGQVNAGGSVSGNVAAAGGTANPGSPTIAIPEINPSQYRQYADYVMGSDGKVYNRFGSVVQDTTCGSACKWFGWYRDSTSPLLWKKYETGCCPSLSPQGMYFIEGNVEIANAIGSAGSPWVVSIFATGSIRSTGASTFENYRSPDPAVPQGVKDVFMMAGGDIYIRGNFSASLVPGTILSNEEVDVGGASNFQGNVIARNSNHPDPSGIISYTDVNLFAGSHAINYNPSLVTLPFLDTPARRQWRTAER